MVQYQQLPESQEPFIYNSQLLCLNGDDLYIASQASIFKLNLKTKVYSTTAGTGTMGTPKDEMVLLLYLIMLKHVHLINPEIFLLQIRQA